MQDMQHWVAYALFGYVALQMLVAWGASRFIKSEADYLVAGRSLGVFVAGFSLFATWFGAETVMGSSGVIAAEGLSGGRADPFGYAICLLLFGLLIAAPMRRREYMTSGDFYRDRFNAPTEVLAVAVQVLTSVIWAAAQVLAFAHIIAAVSGIPVGTAIVASLSIVVVYTMVGGILGDVITDTMQGIVLIAGLFITLAFVIAHIGGMSAALEALTPERLRLLSDAQPLGVQLDEWTVAILGSLTAQEAISRALASRAPDVARKASFMGAGIYMIAGLAPVAIGLIGVSVMPVGDDVDNYLPLLAREILPLPVYVIFMGALVSAILSTVNSTVLSAAALVGHNVVERIWTGWNDRQRLRLQRAMIVVIGVAIYFIATGGDSIYDLILKTSSFGSAGLLVVMLAGLWLRWGGPWTGFATVLGGIVMTWAFQEMMALEAAYIAAVAGCVLIYAVGGWAGRRRVFPAPNIHNA